MDNSLMEKLNNHVKIIKEIIGVMDEGQLLDITINQLASARTMIDAALNVAMDVDKIENCQHPVEQRINYSTMGGPEEWECRLCGYEYKEGEGDKSGNEGEKSSS